MNSSDSLVTESSDLVTADGGNTSDQAVYDSSWVPAAQFAMEGVTQGIVGVVGLVGREIRINCACTGCMRSYIKKIFTS